MHKTVLIVEDHEGVRVLMKFLLEDSGYEVLEAANGQEAIEKVENRFPDLILMDMKMPVMDGVKATQTIRKFDGGDKLPIIAVTEFGKSYQRKAMEAGCDYLFNKPLDMTTMKLILHLYLDS